MPEMIITPVSKKLRAAFAIARGAKTTAETVTVELRNDKYCGRGECVPYPRYAESVNSVIAQLQDVKGAIESGLPRQELQDVLPAGAARCAVDCALWDLEAKIRGQPVWQLAGLPKPKPLPTAMTLSLDRPQAMAAAARASQSRLLKLKLGRPDDLDRIKAVNRARPDAQLILDGNEGLEPAHFPILVRLIARLGVIMIEQPFPVGRDHALLSVSCPVPVCADESVHTCEDIGKLSGMYDAVNIKLDKAGGLTGALALVRAARRHGLGVMIGCMVAGSLSMAPAMLLGGCADLVDLDGPLWLARDVPHGLRYVDGMVAPPAPALWG